MGLLETFRMFTYYPRARRFILHGEKAMKICISNNIIPQVHMFVSFSETVLTKSYICKVNIKISYYTVYANVLKLEAQR
jgi:hypothetical protein